MPVVWISCTCFRWSWTAELSLPSFHLPKAQQMQQIQTTAWSESAVHAFADLGLRSCHYHHFIYQKRSKCSRFKPQQIIKSDPCNDCVTSTDSARMERHILLPLVALRVPQPWSELHAARRCQVAHVGWSTFRAQNKLLPRYPEIAWRLSLVLRKLQVIKVFWIWGCDFQVGCTKKQAMTYSRSY